MTWTTQAVLRAFLDDLETPRYGFELGALTGLASGTVHPILARLEAARWVESFWEDIDTAAAGRPRRRYYRLTADGVPAVRMALAEATAGRARLNARLRPIADPG
jgi:DNA-binding PadR family transcriptional regulator